MHRLLTRQLRCCLGDAELAEPIRSFVAAVDAAYSQFESDYALLERSLDLSSGELVQANAELRAMIEAFPDLFLWVEFDGTISSYRTRSPKNFLLPPDQLIGRRIQTVPVRGAQHEFDRALVEIRAGAASATVEYTLWLPEGERAFEARLLPVGRDRVLAAVRDVTDRAEAHRRLLDSEQRYRLLFENSPQPMWVFDLETLRFLAVNDAAVRTYGFSREEFLSMSVGEVRLPEERGTGRLEVPGRSATSHADGLPMRHARHRRKDGAEIRVEVVSHGLIFLGRPAVMALIQDVTEKIQLEDRLRQAQKMEAVGRLAGGVAHDFNNLLTAMLGFTHLARQRLQKSDPTQLDLEQVQRAAERAAGLTRQLLAFSRQQVLAPRLIDLNLVVREMQKLLRRLISEEIEFVTVTAPDLDSIRADPGQIEQVLVNLVVNAGHAMPRGGQLSISTANVHLSAAQLEPHPALKPGRFARIEVTDTGTGMTPEIMSRIFEPFYTTKAKGNGTGLGLSTVLGIVEQSGGYIEVRSAPGNGTTFSIYLPQAASRAGDHQEDAPDPVRTSGSETILVVEDEDLIRQAICAGLVEFGYRALDVGDFTSALKLLGQSSVEIDLMLSDVVMPGMSGTELVERALLLRPELRCLLMSGYTEQAVLQRQSHGGDGGFIQKPFAPVELAGKVRQMLERPARRAAA